jgi:plasmid stability protein
MAQLVVRKLEDGLVRVLRERAASAGVSMEEEHRRILHAALRGPRAASDFKEHLLSIPGGGADRLFERRRTTSRRRTGF